MSARFEGPCEFRLVAHFEHRLDACLTSRVGKVDRVVRSERTHDQQRRRRADGTRLEHLHRVDMEVLLDERASDELADRTQVIAGASEFRRLGQYRDRASTAVVVLSSPLGCVDRFIECTLRRGPPFDLGDDRHWACR